MRGCTENENNLGVDHREYPALHPRAAWNHLYAYIVETNNSTTSARIIILLFMRFRRCSAISVGSARLAPRTPPLPFARDNGDG